jgi:hypothetical protein
MSPLGCLLLPLAETPSLPSMLLGNHSQAAARFAMIFYAVVIHVILVYQSTYARFSTESTTPTTPCTQELGIHHESRANATPASCPCMNQHDVKQDTANTMRIIGEKENKPVVETVDELMEKRLAKVLLACGELCSANRPVTAGRPFGSTTAKINCEALFREDGIDAKREQEKAPYDVSEDFIRNITMGGRIPWKRYEEHFDNAYLGASAKVGNWTRELIDEWVQKALSGELEGNYGVAEARALMDSLHKADLRGKNVLVVGSESPWVEALCLAAGAAHVTTLEYGVIHCAHPSVSTMTPSVFRKKYLAGTLGKFERVVTFSSLEHPGLARYGDALNPWGDIIAVARTWCVADDKDGKLVIAVPYGDDAIFFNAHRQYGPVRYPYLVTNWRLEYEGIGSQRVHVFKKFVPTAPRQ